MSDSESNAFVFVPEEKWDADEFNVGNNGPQPVPGPGREGGAPAERPDGNHRGTDDEEQQEQSEEEESEEETEGEEDDDEEQRPRMRNIVVVVPEVERIALNAQPVTADELLVAREEKFLLGERLQLDCIRWVNGRCCWVRLVGNSIVYKKLERFLLQNYRTYPNTVPILNHSYIFRHEQYWYRGNLENTKTDLVVRCIDTGKKFSYERHECRRIPREIARVPSLAFMVLVTEDSVPDIPTQGLMNVQVLEAKIQGKYQIRILDNVETDRYESPASKIVRRVKSGMSNVLNRLGVGMSGVFRATDVIRRNTMVGYLVPNDIHGAVLSYKHVMCLSATDMEPTEADVGDYVVVNDDNCTGFRGIIKSKSGTYGYEAVLVDAGYVVYSNQVYKMPISAENLIKLEAKIVIKSIKAPINIIPDCIYYFEIKAKMNRGKWLCLLKRDFTSEEFAAECIIENVHKELHRIRSIPFDPCSVVFISSVSQEGSDTVVHVRRLDGGFREELRYMNREIGFLVESRNLCHGFPRSVGIGDLVAAKFTNGKYYRASVIDRNDKDIRVFFIDYGNETVVNTSDVTPLPHNLIVTPAYARIVKLSGPRNSTPEGADDYLESLMKNRDQLILHYTGDIEDGVVLIKEEVRKINPSVFGNIAVTAKTRANEFASNFFGQYQFTAGVMENMSLLHVDEMEFQENGAFWIKNPLSDNVDEELMAGIGRIGEYCRSQTQEYSPENGELCFAYYQDDWHRGYAKTAVGKDYEILLIDIGRSIFLQAKSIRKMNEEFFLLPSIAMKCNLQGFDTLEKEDVSIAYDYLRNKISGYIDAAEIVEVNVSSCIVDIPELKEIIAGSI